jgi:hypothetical protein
VAALAHKDSTVIETSPSNYGRYHKIWGNVGKASSKKKAVELAEELC